MPLGIRSPFFRTNSNKVTDEQLQRAVSNAFNQAFFWGSYGTDAFDDDQNVKRYIDLAYNINPDVYSVINQITSKFNSVPYSINKVTNQKNYKKLQQLNKSSRFNYSTSQLFKAYKYRTSSMDEDSMEMPLENPNSFQTWGEFFKLSDTFLQTNGTVYWYFERPELRENADPTAFYVLPSHLMEIVLKNKSQIIGSENPIDYYQLREGYQYVKFPSENVICIKYPNPNYDQNGSSLYGMSPLRAAWKNIMATNKGLDLAVNTLKSGGAFGFMHPKDGSTNFTDEQAKALKERLEEMDASDADLARIAGASAALGFTRISLTPDELKPFDYFSYNMKMVCNALGWDDKLMNNAEASTYDNLKIAEKRVVSNKITSDIILFEEAFNNHVLPLFKGYENTVIYWNPSELPEMQQDYNTLVTWVEKAVNTSLITREEARGMMSFTPSENPNMEVFTVKGNDIMRLEDAINPTDDLNLQ